MTKALLVYTSLTGNTRACATIIESALQEEGVDVTVMDSTLADPTDFLAVDLCLVGTYTYGSDAMLPDEIADFYEELKDVDLTGKVFGTFGSGDTFYEKFCQSVDDFTEQFLATGAHQGAPAVKIDLDPESEDEIALRTFAKQLVETYKKT